MFCVHEFRVNPCRGPHAHVPASCSGHLAVLQLALWYLWGALCHSLCTHPTTCHLSGCWAAAMVYRCVFKDAGQDHLLQKCAKRDWLQSTWVFGLRMNSGRKYLLDVSHIGHANITHHSCIVRTRNPLDTYQWIRLPTNPYRTDVAAKYIPTFGRYFLPNRSGGKSRTAFRTRSDVWTNIWTS